MASTMSATQALIAPSKATVFSPDDIYIAVMGVTGAGKSTFISKCCENASSGIGHETLEVEVFNFVHSGKTIHLIDTPGFDDTYRTDSDVLQDLAYWLTTSYKDFNIKLTGIIYLHRITDSRMSGSAMKNLRTFQKLCGKKSMSSVVLVTTMWENVKPADGDIREADLAGTAEFWGDMLRENSTMMRHLNNHHSAMNVVMHLMHRRTTTVLEIQTEMVDLNRPLDETEAGREVEGELIKQRRLFERRLQRAEDEMKEAIAKNDKKHIEELSKDAERWQKAIKDSEKGQEDLRINLENLIKEKELQHQRDKEAFDAKLKKQEEEIQKKDELFKEWQDQKEREEAQREKKRQAVEDELRAAQDRIDEGDEAAKAIFIVAVQKLQEAHEEKEELQRQHEAKLRSLQEEQAAVEMMRQKKNHQLAFQRQCLWEQQQRQQQQQYEEAMWQQYHYQQQQQQILQNRMLAGAGTAGVAGAGLGVASAIGAASMMGCTVM